MTDSAPSPKSFFDRARTFLQQDVWDIEIDALTRARRNVVRTVRVLQLVLRGFHRDECVLHASSLTFMTLLSFIPVLAIALSMARSFGDPTMLRDYLKENLREWITGGPSIGLLSPEAEAPSPAPEDPDPASEAPDPGAETPDLEDEVRDTESETPDLATDIALARSALTGQPDESAAENAMTIERIEEMIDTAFERIERLNFGALGGIGVAFLLWTVISVLGQVEAAFNRVWGVTEQRSLYRKFTDYLSVVVVVPLLLTAASTIPATSLLSRIAAAAGGATTAVSFPLRAVRGFGMLALMTLSLAFVLRFIPNTKVRLWPGVGGGFLVAVAMTIWMRICLNFQIGLAKYSAFFGSFAVVPLLLFWVYVSWIILLTGAEFSFGLQNADTYRMEGDSAGVSPRTRLIVALDLLAAAARAVAQGDGLLRVAEWNQGHRIPVRFVNDVVAMLVRRGFLVETASESGEFAVRFDTEKTTVADALRALLDDGDAPASVGVRPGAESPFSERLDQALAAALHTRLVDLGGAQLLPVSSDEG